jgi:hypothetical protein
MSNEWQDIKKSKPAENQPVWYYFEVFDKVYDGYYSREDVSDLYNKPAGTYYTDCFSGRHGWLCDDVDYWMPREEGQEKPKFVPVVV